MLLLCTITLGTGLKEVFVSPRGLEWLGSVELGGMWSSVTGTRVAWDPLLPSLQRSLSSLSALTQLRASDVTRRHRKWATPLMGFTRRPNVAVVIYTVLVHLRETMKP